MSIASIASRFILWNEVSVIASVAEQSSIKNHMNPLLNGISFIIYSY